MKITVPANLSSTGKKKEKLIAVDSCIFEIVKALNDAGIYTIASCCGHGKQPGSIIFRHKGKIKEIRITTFKQARKIDKLFPPINP